MATQIPDLWPQSAEPDAASPLVILRAQVHHLTQRTGGLLEANITTISTEDFLQHQFDVIAPAWNNYRTTLFKATHRSRIAYPVTITASCFEDETPMSADKAGKSNHPQGTGPAANERTAETPSEFMSLVREVLTSTQVQETLRELVARVNDLISSVFCNNCGTPIRNEPANGDPAQRKPCPKCGSLSRRFDVSLSIGVASGVQAEPTKPAKSSAKSTRAPRKRHST